MGDGHHCKNRELHVLIVGEEKEDDDISLGLVNVEEQIADLEGIELSLNSVVVMMIDENENEGC